MGRSPCCDENGLKKGPWTSEEDTKLIQYIQMHGPGNWRNLPKNAGLQRCGKSCRLRWTNYLRPDIKRGRFSFEEEETIIQLHSFLGNKWSAIAARLPGRTDNEIKNYWNTHIRKRLLRNGIDPVTHAPRLDLLHISTLLGSQQSQLDLSNLLRLQTLLSNPEALRLALSSLLTSSSSSHDYQNPNTLLQKIQENHLSNCQVQDQQTPVFQPNQFEDIINKQIPLNNIIPNSTFQNEIMQGNSGPIFAAAHQYSINSNLQEQNMQNSFFASFDNDCIDGNMLDNTNFYRPAMNSNSNSSQNFSFDSVLSTPSVSVNNIDGAAHEDDDDDLFKFEIPESFDLDELL